LGGGSLSYLCYTAACFAVFAHQETLHATVCTYMNDFYLYLVYIYRNVRMKCSMQGWRKYVVCC
jgi:hypothetical protein